MVFKLRDIILENNFYLFYVFTYYFFVIVNFNDMLEEIQVGYYGKVEKATNQ